MCDLQSMMEGEEWYLEDLTWCLSGMDEVNGRRG